MQIQVPADFSQATQTVGDFLPNLLGAVAVLVAGWIGALLLSVLARRLVRRSGLQQRLSSITDHDQASPIDLERIVQRGVFVLLMLLVLVGMFQVLNLSLITEPLNTFLGEIGSFAPRILGAVFLLAVAWLVATLLRRLVAVGVKALRLDERIAADPGQPEAGWLESASLAKGMGDAVYWLVLLLFLPAILGALAIDGIMEPVQGVTEQMLGYLPNILGAAILFVAGWFVARLVRNVVRNSLAAVGADALGQRIGLGPTHSGASLSRLTGIAVYVLILIPVAIAALNALEMDAVTAPASAMLTQILGAIPAVFAAALLLGIAYMAGHLVGGMAASFFEDSDLDRLAGNLGVKAPAASVDRAGLVRSVVVTIIMLFAAIEAASLVGFTGLSALLTDLAIFGGQALVGLVIFGVGLYLANLADRAIRSSRGASSGHLAIAAKASIIVLATAMALGQVGVAGDVLNLAFGLLLGSIAIAVALAFGLGSRDIASEQVRKWLGRSEEDSS